MPHDTTVTDFAKLHDDQLVFTAKLLEQKLHALRTATSALGITLHQQYRDRLDQVRLEQERRAGI